MKVALGSFLPRADTSSWGHICNAPRAWNPWHCPGKAGGFFFGICGSDGAVYFIPRRLIIHALLLYSLQASGMLRAIKHVGRYGPCLEGYSTILIYSLAQLSQCLSEGISGLTAQSKTQHMKTRHISAHLEQPRHLKPRPAFVCAHFLSYHETK